MIKDSLKTIALSLAILSLISVAYAWTEPSSNPPAGNVSAPINTSGTGQIKSGSLQVNGFRNLGGTALDGTLSVGGNITSGGQSVITSLSAGSGISISGSGNSRTITNTSGSIGSGTTNYLSKWTSGSTLGNSIIYDDGTNVGIGGVPLYGKKLEVTGDVMVIGGAKFLTGLKIGTNEIVTSKIFSGLSVENYSASSVGNGSMVTFKTYNPTNTGLFNVGGVAGIINGIGAGSNPAMNTRLGMFTFSFDGTTYIPYEVMSNSIGKTTINYGNVGIGTTAPKNKLDVEGGVVIGATYSGTNTAPSNGLLVQGNVGIGTTIPTSKLQVAGLPVYADNAAAKADGLTAGAFYRTSTGVLMAVY